MIQRLARIGRSRLTRLAMGLLIVACVLAAVPPASANTPASSLVFAIFSQDSDPASQPCSTPGDFTYQGAALEVYNPCPYRVWIHYVSGSGVAAYCVNPGGGLAYDLPITWEGGDSSDLQISNNTSSCDLGATWGIQWSDNGGLIPETNGCQNTGNGNPFTEPAPLFVAYVVGSCNFRIWLHANTNGSGASYCISPGSTGDSPSFGSLYHQVNESYNQAPCNAGGAPYPY